MSSNVTVHFNGICTFISQATLPELPVPYRAALVNASLGREVRGVHIPAHIAGIEISFPLTEAIYHRLHGCRLTLTNLPPAPLDPQPSFFQLPNLTTLTEHIETMGTPSHGYFLDRDREKTSCHFDITAGTVSASLTGSGSAQTTLVIDTTEALWLEVEPFPSSVHDFESMAIPPGTTITISNFDIGKPASNYADFLLHYLTVDPMPHAPQVPQEILPDIAPPLVAPAPGMNVGAGCSNSTYP